MRPSAIRALRFLLPGLLPAVVLIAGPEGASAQLANPGEARVAGYEIDSETFQEAAYCAGALHAFVERAERDRHPNLADMEKEIEEFAYYWRGPPARRVYEAETGQEWFNAGQIAVRSYLTHHNAEALDQVTARCDNLEKRLLAEEEHVRLVGEAASARAAGRIGPCVDPDADGSGGSISEEAGDLVVSMDPCTDVDALALELEKAIERGLSVGDPFKNEAPAPPGDEAMDGPAGADGVAGVEGAAGPAGAEMATTEAGAAESGTMADAAKPEMASPEAGSPEMAGPEAGPDGEAKEEPKRRLPRIGAKRKP